MDSRAACDHRCSGGAESAKHGRFKLSVTPALQQLLNDSAKDEALSEELREHCRQHAGANAVPWRLAQALCHHSRRPGSKLAPTWLHEASSGGSMQLASPAPRQRPQALQRRLEALQRELDNKRYADMVADVTAGERRAAELSSELFPTTRLQLSFGLHVVVTMGTFFALGFYGGKFMFGSDTWAAVLGALGVAAALLLETSLLIIRSNLPEPLEKKYGHLMTARTDWRLKRSEELARGGAGMGHGRGANGRGAKGSGSSEREGDLSGHNKKIN